MSKELEIKELESFIKKIEDINSNIRVNIKAGNVPEESMDEDNKKAVSHYLFRAAKALELAIESLDLQLYRNKRRLKRKNEKYW